MMQSQAAGHWDSLMPVRLKAEGSTMPCRLIADDEASYRYLVESIRRFPDHVTFKGMMQQAGFSSVKHIPMSGRIVVLYSGVKL